MIGAISGDVIGSVHKGAPAKAKRVGACAKRHARKRAALMQLYPQPTQRYRSSILQVRNPRDAQAGKRAIEMGRSVPSLPGEGI
jgi:hypothetical protein